MERSKSLIGDLLHTVTTQRPPCFVLLDFHLPARPNTLCLHNDSLVCVSQLTW